MTKHKKTELMKVLRIIQKQKYITVQIIHMQFINRNKTENKAIQLDIVEVINYLG